MNPDFLFSGEGPGDWVMPYYVLGYYRIGWGTRHALRYIDPQAPLMAAVRGWMRATRSTAPRLSLHPRVRALQLQRQHHGLPAHA